jgi:hypothetical protein
MAGLREFRSRKWMATSTLSQCAASRPVRAASVCQTHSGRSRGRHEPPSESSVAPGFETQAAAGGTSGARPQGAAPTAQPPGTRNRCAADRWPQRQRGRGSARPQPADRRRLPCAAQAPLLPAPPVVTGRAFGEAWPRPLAPATPGKYGLANGNTAASL